ncbi:MAG: alpha/beta hydrolase [Spirosomataceae bacterium]
MYLKISLGIIFTFLAAVTASAQHLRHKGTLGMEVAEASDSLLSTLKFPNTQGVLVKHVVPHFTADVLGIMVDDIIVDINDTDSLDVLDFQKLERELNENEPISITFIRGRRKTRVVGKTLAGRRESSLGEVIYGEVAYGTGFLRTIVHKPFGAARFPAVFYLQDYDCGSVEFSVDSLSPVKKLVDGWVKAGFAVVRVEKPGVGESAGTKPCHQLNYGEELVAFQNAFAAFKKLPFIDSTQLFLFGYSLGGVMAPLLAAKAVYKPRGIMVYGTVVKPWFEHMLDVFRKQPVLFNESLPSVDVNVRMLTPLLYEWLVQRRNASDLLTDPNFEAILTSKENPLSFHKGTFFGRSGSYFSDLNSQSPVQAWVQAAVPTLAIYGEFDSKAISSESSQQIARLVNEAKPGKGTYKLLKGTDQSFVKVRSFDEYLQLRRTGKYRTHALGNFNSELIDMTVQWMKQQ